MKSANIKRIDGCKEEHKYAAEDMALSTTGAFQKETVLSVHTKLKGRLEKSSTDKVQR